MKKEDFSQKNK